MAVLTGQQVLNFLMQFVGQPYVWGGQAPGGFDCSGLMWYGYQQFGVNIPRTSNAQIAALRQIPIGQAQIGDLVFFDSDSNGQSDHVGMYAGNGQVLVADNPSVPIHLVSVSTEARITGVGRPPGIVNSTTYDGGLLKAGTSGTLDINGLSFDALVPSSRPSIDLFGPLGLQSPNSSILNENYGLSAAFLESDPELANLYSEAVANTWSTDQFQAALEGTSWWQTNSATARQLLVEKQTNPAQYQQDLTAKVAELTEQATSLGVHLSTTSMQSLASLAMMTNMTNAQIDGYMSKYLELSQQGHFSGYAGQIELGVREYARDMGVPVTDDYVNSQVTGIVAGTGSLQTTRAYIQNLAQQMFPAYADQINQGQTVGQIAAPYLATQAKIWETDPNKIDLFDPTLRAALTKVDPSKDPQNPIPMSVPLYQFETTLRQDPRWLQTNNARESIMSSAQQVLSDMGLTAGSVGNAPQTSTSVTDNSRADYGSLSGATSFPTLQGQQYQSPPSEPTTPTAASLAPDTSFKVT